MLVKKGLIAGNRDPILCQHFVFIEKIIYKTVKIRKDRISRKIRKIVLSNDDYKYKYCGVAENLSVDHIKPESLGGTLELKNLQTLCRICNSKKGAIYEI